MLTLKLFLKIHLFTWKRGGTNRTFAHFLEKWSSPVFESMATCCDCVPINSQPHELTTRGVGPTEIFSSGQRLLSLRSAMASIVDSFIT